VTGSRTSFLEPSRLCLVSCNFRVRATLGFSVSLRGRFLICRARPPKGNPSPTVSLSEHFPIYTGIDTLCTVQCTQWPSTLDCPTFHCFHRFRKIYRTKSGLVVLFVGFIPKWMYLRVTAHSTLGCSFYSRLLILLSAAVERGHPASYPYPPPGQPGGAQWVLSFQSGFSLSVRWVHSYLCTVSR
jgi:hypothetical protein